MFTQAISMDCTKEQYERHLRGELLKMGYEERTGYWEQNDVISNNHNSEHGLIGNTYSNNRNTVNRTYLGSFNAPLFLALAAMTDSERVFGYREWAKQKNGNDFKLPKVGENYNPYWRKATKEEIMERFGHIVKEPGMLHVAHRSPKLYVVSREDLRRIHDMACWEWKSRILDMVSEYQEDSLTQHINLPEEEVGRMFEAATTSQLCTLRKIFPDFSFSGTPFLKEFRSNTLDDISTMLFGDEKLLQIGNDTTVEALGVPHLCGKSLFIKPGYKVKLHEDTKKGTIIEIVGI